MSPKINENIIDFWRYVIYLTFLSHWFLEISCRAEKSRAEKLGAEKSGLKHHVACPDYDNVPLIFGDIRYVYVSKNQWDILLAMDFIDSIDFQRYSPNLLNKSISFGQLIMYVRFLCGCVYYKNLCKNYYFYASNTMNYRWKVFVTSTYSEKNPWNHLICSL